MSKLPFYFTGNSFSVRIRIRHYADRSVAAARANFKTGDRSFFHTVADYDSLPVITDFFPAIRAYCRIGKLHRFHLLYWRVKSRYPKPCWRAALELSPSLHPGGMISLSAARES